MSDRKNVPFRSITIAVHFLVALLAGPAGAGAEQQSPARRLIVATRQAPPFAMHDGKGNWNGISIDLLREVASDLHGDTDGEIELQFREFGLREMLEAVEDGEVDIAAAALTVNHQRERRMDFTHPFYSTGLGIAVSGEAKRGWSGVLTAILSRTFLGILGGLMAVLIATGILVFLFERKRNPEHFGGGTLHGIANGIWWAAVTATTVGYGDKVPKSVGGKVIALLWMFAGLFVIAGFTAAVTSALTVNELKSRVSGPSDLTRVRVGTVRNSTSEDYLRLRHLRARRFDNVEAALSALELGTIDAVVYDAPILRHECFLRHADRLHVLRGTFERQDYAFALPTGSPLREQINQSLLQTIAGSDWQRTLESYLGESVDR